MSETMFFSAQKSSISWVSLMRLVIILAGRCDGVEWTGASCRRTVVLGAGVASITSWL